MRPEHNMGDARGRDWCEVLRTIERCRIRRCHLGELKEHRCTRDKCLFVPGITRDWIVCVASGICHRCTPEHCQYTQIVDSNSLESGGTEAGDHVCQLTGFRYFANYQGGWEGEHDNELNHNTLLDASVDHRTGEKTWIDKLTDKYDEAAPPPPPPIRRKKRKVSDNASNATIVAAEIESQLLECMTQDTILPLSNDVVQSKLIPYNDKDQVTGLVAQFVGKILGRGETELINLITFYWFIVHRTPCFYQMNKKCIYQLPSHIIACLQDAYEGWGPVNKWAIRPHPFVSASIKDDAYLRDVMQSIIIIEKNHKHRIGKIDQWKVYNYKQQNVTRSTLHECLTEYMQSHDEQSPWSMNGSRQVSNHLT